MNWKIAWHQVAIALLIGFAGGAAFGQWYFKEARHAHHGKRGDMKQHMLERLDRKLSLTADQKTQIKAIFEAKKPEMIALQGEIRPKFEALKSSTQKEIRMLLTPEQQIKFDEMNAKMEARWKEREKAFHS